VQLQTIAELSRPIWIEVPEDEDGTLRLQIVPAGIDSFNTFLYGENERRLICQEFFVDFDGYSDGDRPVKNTLEARMQLLRWPPVRKALNQQVNVIASRQNQGEAVAVSA